jgi:hypothetical protein
VSISPYETRLLRIHEFSSLRLHDIAPRAKPPALLSPVKAASKPFSTTCEVADLLQKVEVTALPCFLYFSLFLFKSIG